MTNGLQASCKNATVHGDPFHHKGLCSLRYEKWHPWEPLGHAQCSKGGHFHLYAGFTWRFLQNSWIDNKFFQLICLSKYLFHHWSLLLWRLFLLIDILDWSKTKIKTRNHSFILPFFSLLSVFLSNVFWLVLFLRSLLKIIFVSH